MEANPTIHYRCLSCSEIPPEEIYMCRNGHAICKRCYKSSTITTCPVNNCVLDKRHPIRCRNLESILTSTELYCKFKVNGCDKRLLGIYMADHEINCEFEAFIQSTVAVTTQEENSLNKFRTGLVVTLCILMAVWAVYLAPYTTTPIRNYGIMETSEDFSNEIVASRNYAVEEQTYTESEESLENDDSPYSLLENTIRIENREVALAKLKLLFESGQYTKTDPYLQGGLLLLACSSSNGKIVKYLIEEGFPMNVLSSDGKTPLHLAVTNKNNAESLEICKILLENGADCNIKSVHKFKLTPYEFAQAAKGPEYSEELEQLYYKLNPSCTPIRGRSFAKEIIKREKEKLGVSPLSTDQVKELIRASAGFINWEGLKYFLEVAGEEEIDINSVECEDVDHEFNSTYLHLVLSQESKLISRGLDKIKFLVEEKGANVHAMDGRGMSLLHVAVLWYTAESVEYLLSKGLDVNAKTTKGHTPLSLSLRNEDEAEGNKTTITLLKNGAECENLQMGDYEHEMWKKYRTRLHDLYRLYKPSCL